MEEKVFPVDFGRYSMAGRRGQAGHYKRKASARSVGETWRGPVWLSPSTGRRIKGDKTKS